ncbi:MAG TPA: universal stress protein [Terriglobales bacterium]|nr:universal stress protein [Terriglobales bacterium]
MSLASPVLAIGLKRILVATDFSEFSEKPLHCGLKIARHYGAKLYLANVVSALGFTLAGPDVIEAASESAWRDARHLEERLVKTGALAGLEHDLVIREGNVWEQLEEVVEQEHVDLIVIGTHGRTGLRKIVLGSVAEEVFRHASCPVLTVGPCAPENSQLETGFRHVLYPTDLSEDSAQAAQYAVSLAKEYGARLTLLHVVEQLEGEAALDQERITSVQESRLREFLPAEHDLSYNLNFRVEIGPIDETILGFAKDRNVGLIVLGLRSPDTFVNHLVWLHAYKIICEACCPVLTVRSRAS